MAQSGVVRGGRGARTDRDGGPNKVVWRVSACASRRMVRRATAVPALVQSPQQITSCWAAVRAVLAGWVDGMGCGLWAGGNDDHRRRPTEPANSHYCHAPVIGLAGSGECVSQAARQNKRWRGETGMGMGMGKTTPPAALVCLEGCDNVGERHTRLGDPLLISAIPVAPVERGAAFLIDQHLDPRTAQTSPLPFILTTPRTVVSSLVASLLHPSSAHVTNDTSSSTTILTTTVRRRTTFVHQTHRSSPKSTTAPEPL